MMTTPPPGPWRRAGTGRHIQLPRPIPGRQRERCERACERTNDTGRPRAAGPSLRGTVVSKEFIPAAKPIIGDEERAAVDAVLRSGMLAQGSEVASFEQEFSAQLVDGRPVVAVNSGTAGLHLGLLAAGVGPGDEGIVAS